MKTITLDLPDNVDFDSKEITLLIACKLYEKGKLSLGQAAAMAGLSKRGFMEILNFYDVSVFNYPASEIDRDLKNAQKYSH